MKRINARRRSDLGRGRALAMAAVVCLAMMVLPTRAAQPLVALRARAMIDVERDRSIENATIVVAGARIVAAGPRSEIAVPAGATVIQLPPLTSLPGLIDAHVHLTLSGEPSANARATLAAGFTTVQDLGAAAYANVALRDAIAAGRIDGPRVVASGPWLGTSRGTCDFSVTTIKARGIRQLPTLFSLSTSSQEDLSALRTHMRSAVAAAFPLHLEPMPA